MASVAKTLSSFMILWHLCSCMAVTSRPSSPVEGSHSYFKNLGLSFSTVYVYRQASYSGGGRPHILKIDNREIGPLTDNNYYRLELWPGVYSFIVSLPRQNLFGEVLQPMSSGKRINIAPRESQSHTLLLCYKDGMSSDNFEMHVLSTPPADLLTRQLGRHLKWHETAQAKFLYDAQYTGPSRGGRAHGLGILTWPDGSKLIGHFVHGEVTDRATFFFSNGRQFMGLYHQGRPYRQGVLLNQAGEIVFAGSFKDEQPDGLGLRRGINGPEFCFYAHGKDRTKTSRQMARDSILIEEARAIHALWEPVITLERKTGTRLEQLRQKTQSHQRTLQASFDQNRYARELAAVKLNCKDHQAKINAVRQWCAQELAKAKRPCICAPVAPAFSTWSECTDVYRLQRMLPDPFSHNSHDPAVSGWIGP